MKVFVDRFLSDRHLSGTGLFIKDLMEELARRNPDHQFVMPAGLKQTVANLAPNITIYPVNRLFLQGIGKKWWRRWRLPGILKEQAADVLICIDHPDVLPTILPVCLLVTAVPPDGTKEAGTFFRTFRTASRQLAVIGFSPSVVQRLQQAVAGKVSYLPPTGQPVQPFTALQREAARENYAGGLDYFAFAGDLGESHRLTVLLKAFSIFKKRQRSGMRLVIAGQQTRETGAWLTSLDTYKYRDDVRVVTDPPSGVLHAIIAGAYAFVYPAVRDHLPVNVWYAMQAGVPVVASPVPAITEVAAQAVLYAAGDDETGFAAAMQTVYKDESLRDDLIVRGSRHMDGLAQDAAAGCWQILCRLSQLKSP